MIHAGFLSVLRNEERFSGACQLRKTSLCIQLCAVFKCKLLLRQWWLKGHSIWLCIIVINSTQSQQPFHPFSSTSHSGWLWLGPLLANYWRILHLLLVFFFFFLMETTQWRDFSLSIIVLWIVNIGFREKCQLFS